MSIGSHSIFKRAGENSKRFLCASQDGSKIVIYEDSSIRWCNSFDSKYEFMSLEPTIGDVEHVTLSPSGTLLLLYNSKEVRVVEIPWGYSQVSYEGFQKFRYLVDSKHESPIKQVLFHPLAYREHCIVILKKDNTIHLLDRYYPYDEQPYPLVLNEPDGAFGMEGLVTDIENITFSQDGLTLYALSVSEGCDVYAFYPCLPRSIEIDHPKLDLLLHKTIVQYENLSIETPDTTKRNTIKQFQFISKLRQGLENDQTKIDIPVEWLKVKAQGPFTIASFPDRYYDRTAVQLEILPISGNNDLLLISLDDGTIAVLYRDLELTMCWDSRGYSYNDSLVLIESIRLERGDIKFKQGALGQFFVLSGKSGVYLVDTSPWSKILSNCIENSDVESIANLQFKSEISKIEGVSDVDSYAVWRKDTAISDVFISKDTVFAKQRTINDDQHKKAKDQKRATTDIPRYEVSLNQPMSEILSLNASFQSEAKRPLTQLIDPSKRQAKLNNESNEEQLEILTNVSKEFLQKIVKAQVLGFNLHNRCLEQQYELTRQLQYSGDILDKQEKLKSRSENQSSQCESKLKRQDQLLQRFNNLTDKLKHISESPKFREMDISDKEMAWFREIRNQVLVFNQYVLNQKNLQEQLRYLKMELNKISSQAKDVDDKSKNEWSELLSILENDTKIIKECNNQLAHASSEVGFNT